MLDHALRLSCGEGTPFIDEGLVRQPRLESLRRCGGVHHVLTAAHIQPDAGLFPLEGEEVAAREGLECRAPFMAEVGHLDPCQPPAGLAPDSVKRERRADA